MKMHNVTFVEALVLLAMLALCVVILLVGSGGPVSMGEGDRVGKVVKLSQKGIVWTTWEGELILGGQGTVTSGTFSFSISDPNICLKVQEAINNQKMVRLHYKQNLLPRPWNGSTTHFITSVSYIETESN